MQDKEISNEELRLNEFNKELKIMKERIAKQTRADMAKNIKGTVVENDAAAHWSLNKFPATALEKEKMVADHEATRTKKEKVIQEEIAARLQIEQANLERAHFGALRLKGFQEQEERLRKMDAFTERNRMKQKSIEQKREVHGTANKVIKLQKETQSKIQDNRAYRPTGGEAIKSEFADKAEQTKTVSMEFEAQNKKVKDMAAYKAKLEEQEKQRIKNKRALDFKRQQQQKNKAVIEKQTPSITAEQDNTPTKTIDAGTDFNQSSGTKKSEVKRDDSSIDRDSAAQAFKAKMRVRNQGRSMKHDHKRGHTH